MEDLEKKLFDQSWTFKNREKIIQKMQRNQYDVVIIGAGITGAGVAREAAMRNLSVAVVDMQDFAAGTSSRSTKMAHGGLRYIAYGETALVKSATRERNWMRVQIPHLVRPLPFFLPIIEGSKLKKRDIQGVTKIYDYLSDDKSEFKNYIIKKVNHIQLKRFTNWNLNLIEKALKVALFITIQTSTTPV